MDAAGGGGLGDDAALDALRDVLAALNATAPRLVFHKTLNRCDVDRNQARLLISSRPAGQEGEGGGIADAKTALAAFLTAEEKDIAMCDASYDSYRRNPQGYRRNTQGMQAPAYDRHGRRFDMRLKLLPSNRHYRLFGPGWNRFLADNQLAEAMAAANETGRKLKVELLAFRSLELRPMERRVETVHHPDGYLGMAILIRN